MPQTNITYDSAYNRKLTSLLDEMDAKHWNNGTSQYHPSMMGFKLSNFHGDYAGEPSAKMMVGGGSHGDRMFVPSGNSPAYPPYMMSSGLLVNSGGARIGVDGAVGGYSFNDFIGDVAHVGKAVAPDLIRASLASGAGKKKKGGSKVGDQIASVAKTLLPFAPLLMGLGRPMPRSKMDVVDALKDLGAKKSHTLKKLKEIAMSGGYSFNDFIGDVANVGKEVAPDIIRAMVASGTKKGMRRKTARKAYEGGINLKDVIASATPNMNSIKNASMNSIKNMVQSADPALKSQITNTAKQVLSKVKSAMAVPKVGMGARNKRAEIVKKVMKDRGVSMIQASSIVKNEGLYKK